MTNILIIQAHTDTYDGTHTHQYQVGEIHLVGGVLMPQALHDKAVAAGWGVDTGSTASDIDPTEQNQSIQADSPVNLTPDGL